MTTTKPRLSIRQKFAGENHHLWDNHGTWWFQGTFHLPDGTAERVRRSLRTKCVREARRRRDTILARWGAPPLSDPTGYHLQHGRQSELSTSHLSLNHA
mgnify:CR=1 FL=1